MGKRSEEPAELARVSGSYRPQFTNTACSDALHLPAQDGYNYMSAEWAKAIACLPLALRVLGAREESPNWAGHGGW